MRESASYRTFSVVNVAFLGVLGIATLYPFVNTLATSFSSAALVHAGQVQLIPKGFNVDAYRAVFYDQQYWITLRNTLFLTVVGTAFSMVMTCLFAYPLSKKYLKGRTVIMFLVLVTMLFDGGIIPTYLLMRSLGLLNTIAVLVLLDAIISWYMILLRNFFMSIPTSLEESARMDGANDFLILGRIIIPLSKPAIATISLFYAVNFWGTFFHALIFITSSAKQVVQVYLSSFVVNPGTMDNLQILEEVLENIELIPETVTSATIIATIVPILVVYPWLQKHFVKGVIVGSLKG
jgi:putative aldouronate transport system permease protein